MPTITVLIASYNRIATLPRAVASLRAQTLSDWECLLVDDGSTDGTWEFLQELAAEDPRFHIFQQDHAGQGTALDVAKRHAQSEIICFLDSDDEYMPEHLAMQRDALADADFVYGVPLVTGSPIIPDAQDHTLSISVDACKVLGTFACRKAVLPESFAALPWYGFDYLWYNNLRASGWRIKKVAHRTYLYNRTEPDKLTKQ